MPLDNNNSRPVCDYEGSDYQTSFWEEGGRAYEDGAEAVAFKRMLPLGGKMMLEVGAGAGRNTPRYQGFERVVLMDYSVTQLRQAQERLGRSEKYVYVAADVYRLPFEPGVFDAATMIRVIHHLVDAPFALKQVRETLQPGSVFILEFANKHNLKAIFRYLLRRQEWSPFTLDPVEFIELNFDFHPKAIRQWLGEADFDLQRQLTVSHFRINLLKRLVPTKLLVGLDSMAQLTGNWWQLSPSVFTKSVAVGDTSVAKEGALFRCPACKTSLTDIDRIALTCKACGTLWPVEDGIYNFKDPK